MARYHEYSGDRATTIELVPTALQIAETFERWRDAGLRVYVWDVPDAAVLRRVIGTGVDGAIVREPAWIREVAA